MTPILAESIYWHFPILLVTVSLVYSATRYEVWPDIFREAVVWGCRMGFFLVSIGVALFLVPILPAWISVTIGAIVAVIILYSTFRPSKSSVDQSKARSV